MKDESAFAVEQAAVVEQEAVMEQGGGETSLEQPFVLVHLVQGAKVGVYTVVHADRALRAEEEPMCAEDLLSSF